MATVGQFRRWFMELERAGLRPFYFEVSAVDVNTLYGEPSVVYVSGGVSIIIRAELRSEDFSVVIYEYQREACVIG